ncbi:succinylglutamate desuccinylase/aspartoacylase family protein [Pseudomonas sp. TE21394]
MPIHSRSIDLPPLGPCQTLQLQMHEFSGEGSSRSAYIQAGLHADEHPGLLVVQHLLQMLLELSNEGRILGRVVICPCANPVGMTQNVLGAWTGRFNLANGENFNRNFPDLLPVLEAQLEGNPGAQLSPAQRLKTASDSLPAVDTVSTIRRVLLGEALQHDVVIDLHCDTAGELHLYSTRAQQSRALKLAESMKIKIVFLEDGAGGQPFDESCNRPWNWLIENRLRDPSDRPFAATVELRGQADVDDELAREDAMGLLRFLAKEGLIRLDFESNHPLDRPQIYPLEGASHLLSPGNGILAWKKRSGEQVLCGELIGELIPVGGSLSCTRIPIRSDVDGVVVVQPLFKLVRTGQRVALLAGAKPLANRKAGQLLHNF